MYGLSIEDNAKEVIKEISEEILKTFEGVPLLHKYDVYQVLMEYVNETMQDDIYAICFEGFDSAADIDVEYATKKKGKETIVTDTIKSFEGRLIPKAVIIRTFFSDLYEEMREAMSVVEIATSEKEELIEDNCGEDGLLADFVDDDKFKADSAIKKRKELEKQASLDDEDKELLDLLNELDKLQTSEKEAKGRLKRINADLDSKTYEKYVTLSLDDLKKLLIEDKWYFSIEKGIEDLHKSVSHSLSNRIVELVERYESTLEECEATVKGYEEKVSEHLRRMGFSW